MARSRLNLPPASGMSFSDDGRLLACIGSRVVVVDLPGRCRLSSILPFSNPCYTSFSPNGDRLAIKGASGHIAVVNPASGEVLDVFANYGGDSRGCAVRFSSSGRELVEGSWRGDLIVRSSTNGEIVERISYPNGLITDIVHDEGRNLWAVLHQPRVLGDCDEPPPSYVTIWQWPFEKTSIWRLPFSKRVPQTFNFGMQIAALCLSPDGNRLAFVEQNVDGRVCVVRVSDGQIIVTSKPIGLSLMRSKLAWSRDGRFVAVTGGKARLPDRRLVLLDVEQLLVLANVPCSPFADDILFSHDGTSLVFGGVDNRCKVMPLTELFQRGLPETVN